MVKVKGEQSACYICSMLLKTACCGRNKKKESEDLEIVSEFMNTETLFLFVRLLSAVLSVFDFAAKASYMNKEKFVSGILMTFYQ